MDIYELGYEGGKLVPRGKSQKKVLTRKEWEGLPKLDFPILSSPHEQGRVYLVQKVGYYHSADGPLPIAVIQGTEYQLPSDLFQWVQDCIGRAIMGANPFPCDVEFSAVGGAHRAEFRGR
jgi:hypothetical protein